MLSLRVRFVLAAALILALFSVSAGWILRESFQASILDRAREQLKLQMFGLIATVDYEAGQLVIPDTLADPRFNQLNSGLLATILHQGKPVWKSRSVLVEVFPDPPLSEPGQWIFRQVQDQSGKNYYQLSISVYWEEDSAATPYTFVVREWDQPYVAQIKSFENTLWVWLGGLVVAAIVLVFGLLNLGFRPFRRLASELNGVEQGRQQRIDRVYPQEVMPVVNNLNRLVEHERSMRERYKNSLGDLAHSLKTPLAVLKGLELESPQTWAQQAQTLRDQVLRMDEIVNYQLKRAISAVPQVSGQGAVLLDMYERMSKVLTKVHSDKTIQFEQDIRSGLRMPWDDGDTLEVLGNLMDNACKYGGHRVRVSGRIQGGQIRVAVEDDGPGIKDGDEDRILRRGVRRDERETGQGIGLAVVADIVSASAGTLTIERSSLGGACFLIRLPLNW
ncbi:MAG: hypothetical protein KAH34_13925 [Ketobacter sp.]|nr:hypothetical protein [Ketobacter sp.]MEC8813032.1 ATP-binding protein [Pseudomonadota bacterium]